MSDTFDVQKVLGGAAVRCREAHFTPTIERQAGQHSPYALIGSVSCSTGSMAMCWKADGGAVRQSRLLFDNHPDSDFDLLLDE
ncbi:hypothetical protein ACFQ3P_32680 [Paraburkholderia sabiae]|uniref:DUF736 domain-containing protein n=1 Tax=Paraburkholderia sabiae TaxID=273251 RepID=A0ABU9QJE9_9BURK|nr:hypothetical protein [Paraburkholderia sabiae]WJZ80016.1 hypothetical protein QEN71_43505 [Paraburkholderia sabiae]CAD6559514.1 hypothetical protein LMG24235_06696 [Paraburkholderia sabiae]